MVSATNNANTSQILSNEIGNRFANILSRLDRIEAKLDKRPNQDKDYSRELAQSMARVAGAIDKAGAAGISKPDDSQFKQDVHEAYRKLKSFIQQKDENNLYNYQANSTANTLFRRNAPTLIEHSLEEYINGLARENSVSHETANLVDILYAVITKTRNPVDASNIVRSQQPKQDKLAMEVEKVLFTNEDTKHAEDLLVEKLSDPSVANIVLNLIISTAKQDAQKGSQDLINKHDFISYAFDAIQKFSVLVARSSLGETSDYQGKGVPRLNMRDLKELKTLTDKFYQQDEYPSLAEYVFIKGDKLNISRNLRDAIVDAPEQALAFLLKSIFTSIEKKLGSSKKPEEFEGLMTKARDLLAADIKKEMKNIIAVFTDQKYSFDTDDTDNLADRAMGGLLPPSIEMMIDRAMKGKNLPGLEASKYVQNNLDAVLVNEIFACLDFKYDDGGALKAQFKPTDDIIKLMESKLNPRYNNDYQ